MAILFMAIIVLLLVALQNHLYNRFWDMGLDLDLKFSAPEAFEGETIYLMEKVVNRKLLPLPWLTARFRVSKELLFFDGENISTSDSHYRSDVFSIMHYQSITRRLKFTCGKRGYYRLRGAEALCQNILFTKRFGKEFDCDAALTVFPAILEWDEEKDINYRRIESAVLSHSLINPDVFEFKGIREYQPGDSVRFVNFKASAISQQLMVNLHANTSSKRVKMYLNLEPYSSFPDNELYEAAIRISATLASRLIDDDVSVGFKTNGKDISTTQAMELDSGNSSAHLYKIFEALARIGLIHECSAFSEYLDELADDGSVHIIISPNYDKGIMQAFDELIGRGVSAQMIIPHFNAGLAEALPEEDNILPWEVSK